MLPFNLNFNSLFSLAIILGLFLDDSNASDLFQIAWFMSLFIQSTNTDILSNK